MRSLFVHISRNTRRSDSPHPCSHPPCPFSPAFPVLSNSRWMSSRSPFLHAVFVLCGHLLTSARTARTHSGLIYRSLLSVRTLVGHCLPFLLALHFGSGLRDSLEFRNPPQLCLDARSNSLLGFYRRHSILPIDRAPWRFTCLLLLPPKFALVSPKRYLCEIWRVCVCGVGGGWGGAPPFPPNRNGPHTSRYWSLASSILTKPLVSTDCFNSRRRPGDSTIFRPTPV